MDKNTINNRSSERQESKNHLSMERKRALETLKKSQRGVSRNDAFKKPQQVAAPNKNNVKTCINLPVNIRVDNTDFMSSRRPNTINISDLVTDESIHLESVPSCPSSSSKGLKISFEPAEITGRSTLCKKDLRYARNVPGDTLTKNITVNEILASSFAQKARNLCETLNDRDTTISSAVAVHKGNYINVRGQNPASSSTTLSSVSSYNNSLSLPRTADMSLSKISATELTFNSNADNGISFINGTDTSTDNTENFVPGELMQSRLLSDEISWAGQFAAIPTVALSELAKAKADISNNFELNSRSNSILADDPNFSVGNFFNMRSDKICNIVPSKSPERCRTTVALVDETPDVSSSAPFLFSVESPSGTSITPKVDNKTYTRVGEAAFVQNHSKAEAKYQSINSNYDSKDSGNSTGNYAILSMSAIDRALSNLDARLDKDAKTHSCMEPFRDVNDSISHVVNDEVHRRKRATIMDTNIKLFGEEKFNFENEALLANKQNLDPQAILSPKCTQLSDTVSFTQSLLNSSEIQQNETPKVSRSAPFLYSVESPSRTSITPKVDNKKYTRVGEAAFVQNQSKVEAKYQSINSNYDSKHSGNSTGNYDILSMSAIDRALSNLDARLDKDAKTHSCMEHFRDVNDSISHVVNDEVHRRKRATIMDTNIKLFGEEKFNFENEALLANKQNLDPQAILSPKCTQLSDTVSFTQPLLNSSEIQQNETPKVSRSTPSRTSTTPKVDNKKYTRVGEAAFVQNQSKVEAKYQSINSNYDSKDSGNSTENSYILSMSAIDRALSNLNARLDKDAKSHSCMDPFRDVNDSISHVTDDEVHRRKRATIMNTNIKLFGEEKFNFENEALLANKENLDPQAILSPKCTQLSDTVSFTQSLLNSSEIQQTQCNLNVQSRSPLSPIEINSNSAAAVPHIITEILDGEVADNDEWPSTPVVGPNRRVKRKKSPRNPSPLKSSADDPKTPVNPKYKSSTLRPDDINQPKSMSSTRLDCADENGINNCCELISPKLSINKSSSAMLPRHSNGSSNIILSDRQDHDCSPGRLNQSPLSRSTVLPQICSNINDMQSPNMDRTSSPDRHMLTAAAGASELPVCSPVSSETSSTTSRIYRNGPSVTSAVGRSASRCSSSSEFSHSDGKQIPLKVTATELSWGSVKLRTDSRKSMQVKNISNKRLVVRIEVCGPGFQIYNLQGSNAVTIHPQECRAITVNFCPTVCGVAVGKLSLRAPLGCSGAVSASQSFLDIALYGYGGNAKIYPQDIIPAPVGLPFIKVGDISELGEPLRRGFSIYNKGPLVGFAVVAVDSLGLMMPRLSEAFEIRPKQIIIPPSDFVCVNIKFSPKREEIKKIVKKVGQVLTVANMRIVCGDDANRQRIRRLFYQMSTEERSKYSSSILDMLWSKFPDEIELDELNVIHESPSTAMDLTACLRVHEIALTVNNFFWNETAESSLLFGSDADETVLFRTICSAPDSECPSANLYPVDEESTVVTSDSEEKCTVTPEVLDIYLVRPGRMSLLLKNTQKLRQFFKILCNHENAMRFKPADGFVDPNGGQTEIKIILNKDTNVIAHLNDIFIMIFMNDERIRVPVNVHD